MYFYFLSEKRKRNYMNSVYNSFDNCTIGNNYSLPQKMISINNMKSFTIQNKFYSKMKMIKFHFSKHNNKFIPLKTK